MLTPFTALYCSLAWAENCAGQAAKMRPRSQRSKANTGSFELRSLDAMRYKQLAEDAVNMYYNLHVKHNKAVGFRA